MSDISESSNKKPTKMMRTEEKKDNENVKIKREKLKYKFIINTNHKY